MDATAVEKAVADLEAVASSLGSSRPPLLGMMESAAQNILAAMQKAGVKRLVWTSGAGVGDPQQRPGLDDLSLSAPAGWPAPGLVPHRLPGEKFGDAAFTSGCR